MKRKNDLFFLSEIQFRNKLVEHLTEWIMASANQDVTLDRRLLLYVNLFCLRSFISGVVNFGFATLLLRYSNPPY